MSVRENISLKKLEYLGPTAFYIAGGVLILFILNWIALLIGMDLRLLPYINFIAIGDIIAIIGVFGLYPTFSVKAPRLSLIGAVCLVSAAICFIINQVVMLGNNLFQIPGFILPSYVIWINHVSFIAAYLLVGIAALRTNHYPNLLGYALLSSAALAAVGAALTILIGFGMYTTWITVVLVTFQALVYIGIGYILRNQPQSARPLSAMSLGVFKRSK